MKSLVLCLRKDFLEYTRHRKNIICLFILLCISSMVLSVTLFFPSLINELGQKAPEMLIDQESLNEMMAKLFPHNLKGNLGILASDIGIFFTIVSALLCYNLIPSEIREGKWIVPVNCGINKTTLLLAKCMVYSVGIGFPVIAIYNLYF